MRLHYRRNADSRIRRLERAAAGGDIQAQVALLNERLRLGQITLERVSLAAYLGDPGAQAMRLPKPTQLKGQLLEMKSRSLEVMKRGAVSTKLATLFAADCAARALIHHGELYQEESAFELSIDCIEAARAWVGNEPDPENPVEAADMVFNVKPGGVAPRADLHAFEAAEAVGYGCRRQPGDVLTYAIEYSLRAPRQAVLGPGRTRHHVPRDVAERANHAMDLERKWQDAHFINGLLSPSWPTVRLP